MSTTYTISTDEEHKEKIDSNLIYAIWKSGFACAESEAKFEVRTSFVGQGAKIEITVKGDDYGKIKKIKDTISNNRYNGTVSIPEDIEPGENVSFEVKLAKNKLKGKSNTIPAKVKPILTNMQWDKQEARSGDTLTLEANFERVKRNAEVIVVIYEYDQDGNHDKIAIIPTVLNNRSLELKWEYEYHEDVNEIPTEEELQKYGNSYNPPEYYFIVVIDGVRFGEGQESGLLEFKDWVEIVYRDDDEEPVANQKYKVMLPDGSERTGTLDDNGLAVEKGVPPGKIKITFDEDG